VSHPDLPFSERFPWTDLEARLRAACLEGAVSVDATGRWYERVGTDGELVWALRPPLAAIGANTLPPVATWGGRWDASLGRYAILLLQAGAAAVGLFEDDDLLDHKAWKRYVVRGQGKAQPTHLKTRGKSRLGSRLRLRNARRLLEEVSERLGSWFEEDDPPARLYTSCPVRLYADFMETDPTPPVTTEDPRRVTIPLDVHVPTHAELLRVQRSIIHGRAWWARSPDE